MGNMSVCRRCTIIQAEAADLVYPTFMYSRDGANWSFDDPYHSIIDLSAHGQTAETFGQAYPQTTMVERDGLLYIYYNYFSTNHNSPAQSDPSMCLATLPVDRFVGIQSTPGSVGTWTTSTITLPSDPGHLILNATVDSSLRVEVLDPSTGQPFAGYATTDGIAIMPGDFLVRWLGGTVSTT